MEASSCPASSRLSLLFVLSVFAIGATNSAPLSAAPIISNEIPDDDSGAAADEEDDFTTRGLERLSSAATCLVAGVEYTHGQQIYRADQCEFCLCLDGEMFCWWQDCPPEKEGPCKDRGPFTPCFSASSSSSSSSSSSTTSTTTKENPTTHESSAIITSTDLNNGTNFTDSTSNYNSDETEEETSTEFLNSSTTEQPKVCVIMGRKYEIGDKLPHNTGNCIECICGAGAKVSCSPYQCAPAGEDINDYRPPGPRQQLPDVF